MAITGSGTIDYEPVGRVHYKVRRGTHRITARWRGGAVHMSLPPRTEQSVLLNALAEMTPAILRHRPAETFYRHGEVMDFGDLTIKIVSRDVANGRVVARQLKAREFAVEVDPDIDFSDSVSVKAVSDAVRHIGRYVAPHILLPRARQLADEIGRRPLGWDISYGRRTLGRCNSRGIIALSYVVVFLPQHLREYVIWHELAHLSEMNHSPQFHIICDRYCGGRERELNAELKKYRFPII